MPGYRGHIIGALVLWAVTLVGTLFVRHVTGWQAIEFACMTIIGGLFPDLDTKSMAQKWLFRLLFVLGLMFILQERYQTMSLMMLIAIIPLLVRHRGLTHSLTFITCITLGSALGLGVYFPVYSSLIFWDALFFWLGAVSHLYLDGHGIFAFKARSKSRSIFGVVPRKKRARPGHYLFLYKNI
jgi:membrane-bound metal-dependent hydrolase YbcI (DUF457 family)